MATQAAIPALSAVVDAQNAAQDTATYLGLMAKDPKSTKYDQLVKQAGEHTTKLTEIANNALGKSKKTTRQAEARALLARLNIAGLGISADMRNAFDGMVAHYTMSRADEVARLRARGMGHGDAAFALAASKTTGRDPASYATTLADHSMIDAISGQGVRLGGPIILLRYLANAMEKELELAEQTG
jgi:TPR repeat protein